MSEPPAIEVRDVAVTYNRGTPHEVLALANVSFAIARGETIVVTGGNGSGKTTLLRIIEGTAPVTAGRVYLAGRDVTTWSTYRRARLMSCVYQDPMLGTCPNMTVQENFALAERRAWWSLLASRPSLNHSQWRAIQEIGLPLAEKAGMQVGMLSGGQRQALAICLAFESGRSLFLLDEFTASLAEDTKQQATTFVARSIDRLGATALIVTHSPHSLGIASSRALHVGEKSVREGP